MHKFPLLMIATVIVPMTLATDDSYSALPFFPTEAQMDEKDFAIVSPKQMLIHKDKLYILDQGEHGMHIFTTDGSWIKVFGGYGDGPGEMVWPHFASISDKGIMIADQSSLLHFFDLEGNYITRFRVIDFFYRFVSTSHGLFMLTLGSRTPYTWSVWDSDMNRLKSIDDTLSSPYNKSIEDRCMTLRYRDGLVYGLQCYDTSFRIFKENGELVKKTEFELTPMQDPEYQDMGSIYTYLTYDLFKQFLVVNYISLGKLKFLVFDMSGDLVNRASIPLSSYGIKPEEKVILKDMKIEVHNNENFLYALLVRPQPIILKIAFKDKLFEPPQKQ